MTSTSKQDLLAFRKESTDEFGAATLDKAIVSWLCSKCGTETTDRTIRTIAAVEYSDLDSLTRYALDFAKRLDADGPSPRCETCGGETSFALDVHSFHADVGRDIVARARHSPGWFSRWKVECHWWSPENGLQSIKALSPAEAAGMQLSVLVRRVAVASMLQDPDAEALVAEAARALASAPGHPLLMDVAHGLIGFGRTGVAAAIAEAHIAAHPDHAIGHITLGQIIFQVVNHGAMPPEAIDEAVLHIETGLALDPTSLEGTLALASCRRFQRREGEARGLYERILERDPGCALAHYNLGVMVLDTDPATALAHFQFGQEAEPDDPDYPMGIARACVALGQMEMAREALEKVRELAPDHPLLPTIEARLS